MGAVCNRDELILANPMIVVAPFEKQRDAPPESGMQAQAETTPARHYPQPNKNDFGFHEVSSKE